MARRSDTRLGAGATDIALFAVTEGEIVVAMKFHTGPEVGPDDDSAFLGELRRRIDRGHFRG